MNVERSAAFLLEQQFSNSWRVLSPAVSACRGERNELHNTLHHCKGCIGLLVLTQQALWGVVSPMPASAGLPTLQSHSKLWLQSTSSLVTINWKWVAVIILKVSACWGAFCRLCWVQANPCTPQKQHNPGEHITALFTGQRPGLSCGEAMMLQLENLVISACQGFCTNCMGFMMLGSQLDLYSTCTKLNTIVLYIIIHYTKLY